MLGGDRRLWRLLGDDRYLLPYLALPLYRLRWSDCKRGFGAFTSLLIFGSVLWLDGSDTLLAFCLFVGIPFEGDRLLGLEVTE